MSVLSLLCVHHQGCSQWLRKLSTVQTQRKTATPASTQPKLATSTAAARGSARPTLLPAARRTPTKAIHAARSAATKHWGCSWTACPRSSAIGCSSAPVRARVVQSDAGRQSFLIAPTKTRRNPTVWSYERSAVRTLSAGEVKGYDGG